MQKSITPAHQFRKQNWAAESVVKRSAWSEPGEPKNVRKNLENTEDHALLAA